jgi:hypothetical protein
MAWVIDTCVLLDIRIGHPAARAVAAADCLEKYAEAGLIICPITFVEMALCLCRECGSGETLVR